MMKQGNLPAIIIEHLAKHMAEIPTLAMWVHEEWGHLLPDTTLEAFISDFENRTTPGQIPETFVALADDKPLGMASLVKHDMLTRKDLSPWLASVYVPPNSRNGGVGSRLVKAVMQEAEAMGVEKFFLFTPDRVKFYQRQGWKVLEEYHYRGEEVVIMVYETNKRADQPANQPVLLEKGARE